ncbi:Hypothetical predicted protein [Olea europaea subsp. europaea]|uniref:Uncharacterized protein n=1 Tax=Olea europaea subsp. europaea TaxID=158383 RepID=A0A8S0PWW8_OLEEU|nr:Hypothetical predicted protein [Olea europaea subsp. europaea]
MLDSLSSTSSKPSIFRVGDSLRRIKPKAYDPEIITIGPFHREKPHLQNMEQHKLRFQQEPADRDDPIFQNGHMRSQLFHDLMLFENQIPFFIIDLLFNMNKTDDEDIESLIIRPLLENSIFPGLVEDPPEVPRIAHHLLGIVHHNLCSSFANVASGDGDQHNIAKINPAVGLEKAGISFQRSKYQTLFRKLMAYEHYLTGSPQKYVTDYAFFMHCLVKSTEDANVLQCSHIITNFSGSDEMVCRLIYELGKDIIISERFPYSNIFSTVDRHCARIRNTWMATLKREYFNTSWTAISVFAAFTLLGLTLTQTIFAILSYRKLLLEYCIF